MYCTLDFNKILSTKLHYLNFNAENLQIWEFMDPDLCMSMPDKVGMIITN